MVVISLSRKNFWGGASFLSSLAFFSRELELQRFLTFFKVTKVLNLLVVSETTLFFSSS